MVNVLNETRKLANWGKKALNNWFCEECNIVFNTRRELNSHKDQLHRTGVKQQYEIVNGKRTLVSGTAWNKGLTKETDKRVERCSETLNKHYADGTVIPSNLGRSHTDEEKEKLSKTFKKRFSPGKVSINYSEKACEYIDKLNEEKNWHLQHALNGGEFKVGRYSLDGYDKELNIAFEYDEYRHHYDRQGNLLEKDIKRQNYIIKKL
ncbi:MAG: hypothetical protein MJ211_09680 [Bacteroidales bacterium]|nr:hypothetical protein [Bacteroidales bacterium]